MYQFQGCAPDTSARLLLEAIGPSSRNRKYQPLSPMDRRCRPPWADQWQLLPWYLTLRQAPNSPSPSGIRDPQLRSVRVYVRTMSTEHRPRDIIRACDHMLHLLSAYGLCVWNSLGSCVSNDIEPLFMWLWQRLWPLRKCEPRTVEGMGCIVQLWSPTQPTNPSPSWSPWWYHCRKTKHQIIK